MLLLVSRNATPGKQRMLFLVNTNVILGEQKCLPKAWKGSFPSRKSWVPMSRHNVETLVFSYRDAYFKKRSQDNFNEHGGEILL